MVSVPDGDQTISPDDIALLKSAKADGFAQQNVDADAATQAQQAQTAKAIEQSGVAGLGILPGLVKATFFHDLFCHQANARFDHREAEDRVSAMIAAHPGYYRLCKYSDYTYRLFASVLLLGGVATIAGASIFKVFFN
jgi:hypothetical protein